MNFDAEAIALNVQKMAATYQSLSEEYGTLEGSYATEWLTLKSNDPDSTDKRIDQLMAASETGKRMSYLKNMLKGLEKKMSADKARLRVIEMEWKNTN